MYYNNDNDNSGTVYFMYFFFVAALFLLFMPLYFARKIDEHTIKTYLESQKYIDIKNLISSIFVLDLILLLLILIF